MKLCVTPTQSNGAAGDEDWNWNSGVKENRTSLVTAASPCQHQLPVVDFCWATVHFISHSESCIAYEWWSRLSGRFQNVEWSWRFKCTVKYMRNGPNYAQCSVKTVKSWETDEHHSSLQQFCLLLSLFLANHPPVSLMLLRKDTVRAVKAVIVMAVEYVQQAKSWRTNWNPVSSSSVSFF